MIMRIPGTDLSTHQVGMERTRRKRISTMLIFQSVQLKRKEVRRRNKRRSLSPNKDQFHHATPTLSRVVLRML